MCFLPLNLPNILLIHVIVKKTWINILYIHDYTRYFMYYIQRESFENAKVLLQNFEIDIKVL